MSKKSIFKLVFLFLFIMGAFAGIHWYTNPGRCSSVYKGTSRNDFGDESAYDMCTNYYDMQIFKNNTSALNMAKEDYKDVIDLISRNHNISSITDENYEMYLAYVLDLDLNTVAGVEDFSHFLNIYDNGLKRAKPYVECMFIKTFYVIDAMEQYKNDKDYNYIIFKNPDTNDPMIIKLSNDVKESFETDKYYEVTFMNNKNYKWSYADYGKLFEQLTIKNVQETKKTEKNQIQQNGCR